MAKFAVTTAKGPRWDESRQLREQREWEEHARFADELVARGVIIVGGPIGGGNDDDIALLAVEAADEAHVRSIFDDDPWLRSGVFRVKEVRAWTWWLDGRRPPEER
ncbi:MAG: YciI family protein [Acidimicrobiales bacterium]